MRRSSLASAALALASAAAPAEAERNWLECASDFERTPGRHAWRFHVLDDMPFELFDEPFRLSEELDFWRTTRDTNHFSGERYLATALRTHPCHTDDPTRADAIYVPAQPCTVKVLDMIGPHEDEARNRVWREYTERVMDWLVTAHGDLLALQTPRAFFAPIWPIDARREGLTLLSLTGGELPPHWRDDAWRPEPMDLAVTDVVMSYPDPQSQLHFTPEYFEALDRDMLIAFTGTALAHMPTRIAVKEHFDRRPDVALWVETADRYYTGDVDDVIARGTFGLVAAGDAVSTRRLFSLIIAGTIPVIINDAVVLPYTAFVEYSDFCLFVPERRIFEDKAFDLIAYLEAVPRERVLEMQATLARVRTHFLFHAEVVVPEDASDLFVREMQMSSLKLRSVTELVKRNAAFGEWARIAPPPVDILAAEPMPQWRVPHLGSGSADVATPDSGPLQIVTPKWAEHRPSGAAVALLGVAVCGAVVYAAVRYRKRQEQGWLPLARF